MQSVLRHSPLSMAAIGGDLHLPTLLFQRPFPFHAAFAVSVTLL